MKYKVTVGNDNRLYGLDRDMFRPGETVKFTVMFASDLDYSVTSPQVSLRQEEQHRYGEGIYSFVMPACDVTVDIKTSGGMTCLDADPQNSVSPPVMSSFFGMKKPYAKPSGAKPVCRRFCPECGVPLENGETVCRECGCDKLPEEQVDGI